MCCRDPKYIKKLEEFAIQGIVYEQVIDNIGIYPKVVKCGKNPYEKRTEAMEAHNKCVMKIIDNICKIMDFVEGKDKLIKALIDEKVYIQTGKDQIKITVNCNDVFYWAYSDFEYIEESELDDLNECYQLTDYGSMLWVCRKRKMRPQKPWYERFTEKEIELFNECGPEREE